MRDLTLGFVERTARVHTYTQTEEDYEHVEAPIDDNDRRCERHRVLRTIYWMSRKDRELLAQFLNDAYILPITTV